MNPVLLATLFPAAVLLDALLGEPPAKYHPVCLMGTVAQRSEALLRGLAKRKKASDSTLFVAGMLAALLSALPFALAAYLLVWLGTGIGLDWGLALCCVALCLAPRSLGEHARRVAVPLEQGDLESARQAVSMLVGRNTACLDAHGIARACVESVGENVTDGVLATLFWAGIGGLVAGLPGAATAAVFHRVSNVLDALWGKRNATYRRFGTWAARTDDVLNAFPARLSLPIIALASALDAFLWSPTAPHRLKNASATLLCTLRTGWRDRYAHASPNSAWSEAAFAGALDLKLGGPVYYKDLFAPYPFMGTGRLEATPQDIRKSIRLMWLSTLLFALCESVALYALLLLPI
ncbi:MAG: adenosylcobinamide-phosphate synthase CbiB [Bilophila sp.]